MKCLGWVFIFGLIFHVNAKKDSIEIHQQNCTDVFSARIKSIAEEVEKNVYHCKQAANLRRQASEKWEVLNGLILKCNSEFTQKDYFECIRLSNIGDESNKTFNEISALGDYFLKNEEKIKNNKVACLSGTEDSARYKSAYARHIFNLCLARNNQKNPQTENLHTEEWDDYLKKVNFIKKMYLELKSCPSYGFKIKECWEENSNELQRISSEDEYIEQYLVRNFLNDSSYFMKIAELDKAEDTCVRQYLIKNIYPNFEFDLEKCMILGRNASAENEINNARDLTIIHKLVQIDDELKKCRTITKHLDTKKCIDTELLNNPLVKECQREISAVSDDNFKRQSQLIKDSYAKQYPCLEGLHAARRYNGLNFDALEIVKTKDCLMKGYYGRVNPATKYEEIIEDLSTIKNYLKNCILHSESPGFYQCFKNTFWVFQGEIYNIDINYEEFKEIIKESDAKNQTCFEYIRDESLNIFRTEHFSKSEKCILNKI